MYSFSYALEDVCRIKFWGFWNKPYRQRTSYFRRKWLGAVHVKIAPSKFIRHTSCYNMVTWCTGHAGCQAQKFYLLSNCYSLKYTIKIHIDVITVLTDSDNSRKFWSVLKTRLKSESSQLATNCSQLKYPAFTWPGKRRKRLFRTFVHRRLLQWRSPFGDVYNIALLGLIVKHKK